MNDLPQPILHPISEAALFLVMTVEPGGEAAVRDALEEVSALKRSVGFRIPEGELSVVVGIGSDCWDRLYGAPKPAALHPFKELKGERHTAPATPGDLLFHVRAHRMDLCFELAKRITWSLEGAAKVVDEVHGFRSFDERDLLGFVDGTENPELPDAAAEVVLIGNEDPQFVGGSYVIVQKYFHDLKAWNALPVEQQEAAIGRSKLDDIEIPDDEKAPDSHLALNVIEDENGDEREIFRLNMPFGEIGAEEFGTYFIGYASDPDVTETMLRHMFIGDPPGNTDRILDFSTAQTGGLFFVPTAEMLDDGIGGAS
ncbi:MAG: Dyp-type peroxidase [Solirubrobacterales bacterium]